MGCSSSNNTARLEFAQNQAQQRQLILKTFKFSNSKSNQNQNIIPKTNSSRNMLTKTQSRNQNQTNNYIRVSKINLNKTRSSSTATNSIIKRKRYNGLVISGDFSKMFDETVSKDFCENIITKAMSYANDYSNKDLTEQQISVISSLVYNSVKEGKRNKSGNCYICREHIEHPLLNEIYVKMTAQELSPEILFGNYECANKDSKEQEAKKEKKLKILKIQIL